MTRDPRILPAALPTNPLVGRVVSVMGSVVVVALLVALVVVI